LAAICKQKTTAEPHQRHIEEGAWLFKLSMVSANFAFISGPPPVKTKSRQKNGQ